MKLWITVGRIGMGVRGNAFRPNLGGMILNGWVVAADRAGEMLVMVTAPSPTGIAGTYHGAEAQDIQGRRMIPQALRQRLLVEAQRLGVGPDWTPEGYDIG